VNSKCQILSKTIKPIEKFIWLDGGNTSSKSQTDTSTGGWRGFKGAIAPLPPSFFLIFYPLFDGQKKQLNMEGKFFIST
jgi:hypothetical protein